ncbi:MAG TPA: hypothetical protein VG097_19650 [Gemmata sp.]|nr:hypothetical protein [Gemmata sp.]
MSSVTTIVITDPELLTKLAAAEGQIVFRGPSGDTVKTAEIVANGTPPPGVTSPISDEEFEKARKQPDGVPLSEVWRRIHERYGA